MEFEKDPKNTMKDSAVPLLASLLDPLHHTSTFLTAIKPIGFQRIDEVTLNWFGADDRLLMVKGPSLSGKTAVLVSMWGYIRTLPSLVTGIYHIRAGRSLHAELIAMIKSFAFQFAHCGISPLRESIIRISEEAHVDDSCRFWTLDDTLNNLLIGPVAETGVSGVDIVLFIDGLAVEEDANFVTGLISKMSKHFRIVLTSAQSWLSESIGSCKSIQITSACLYDDVANIFMKDRKDEDEYGREGESKDTKDTAHAAAAVTKANVIKALSGVRSDLRGDLLLLWMFGSCASALPMRGILSDPRLDDLTTIYDCFRLVFDYIRTAAGPRYPHVRDILSILLVCEEAFTLGELILLLNLDEDEAFVLASYLRPIFDLCVSHSSENGIIDSLLTQNRNHSRDSLAAKHRDRVFVLRHESIKLWLFDASLSGDLAIDQSEAHKKLIYSLVTSLRDFFPRCSKKVQHSSPSSVGSEVDSESSLLAVLGLLSRNTGAVHFRDAIHLLMKYFMRYANFHIARVDYADETAVHRALCSDLVSVLPFSLSWLLLSQKYVGVRTLLANYDALVGAAPAAMERLGIRNRETETDPLVMEMHLLRRCIHFSAPFFRAREAKVMSMSGSTDEKSAAITLASSFCCQILARLQGSSSFTSAQASQLLSDAGKFLAIAGGFKFLQRSLDAPDLSLRTILYGHRDWVTVSCAVDDDMFVTGSEDYSARVWRVTESGDATPTGHVFDHPLEVTAVCKYFKGQFITGSNDRRLRIWCIDGGERNGGSVSPLIYSSRDFSATISSVAVSPDNREVFVGLSSGVVHVHYPSNTAEDKVFDTHTETVSGLVSLPNNRIVSGSWDSSICVRDISTSKVSAIMKGHTLGVTCIGHFPDGRIVSGSFDKTLRIWDSASGHCWAVLTGHTDHILSVLLLRDGRVASCSEDKTIRVWDTKSATACHVLEGHKNWVLDICQMSQGSLVSVSADKTVRLWDVESYVDSDDSRNRVHRHMNMITSMILVHSDAMRVVIGSADGNISVWSAESGRCSSLWTGHTHSVNALVSCPRGSLVASGSDDKTVRVWSVEDGSCLHVLEGHKEKITCLASLSDGNIASGSADRTVRLWDMSTGVCKHVLKGHAGGAIGLRLSPEGHLLVLSMNNRLSIWVCSTHADKWDCQSKVPVDSSVIEHLTSKTSCEVPSEYYDDDEILCSLRVGNVIVLGTSSGKVHFLDKIQIAGTSISATSSIAKII